MFKVPLIAADPVCGNPPTPVKLAPLPWNEPLNEPEPALDNVEILANEAVAAALNVVALAATEAEVAVTVGANAFALVATDAVWALIAVEAEVAVTVGANAFALSATDAVWALIAVEADVAVTVGAKAFALNDTDAVCAVVAIEAEVANEDETGEVSNI